MLKNYVTIMGRLTDDPRMTYGTTQQQSVARFAVAIDRGKDKNGEDKGADFPNVVCFGKTAELAEKYLGKGARILLEGHLHTGSYTKKNGEKVFTTDVIADSLVFLDFKRPEVNKAEKEDRAYTKDVNAVAAAEANKDDDYEIPEGFKKLTDDDIPF